MATRDCGQEKVATGRPLRRTRKRPESNICGLDPHRAPGTMRIQAAPAAGRAVMGVRRNYAPGFRRKGDLRHPGTKPCGLRDSNPNLSVFQMITRPCRPARAIPQTVTSDPVRGGPVTVVSRTGVGDAVVGVRNESLLYRTELQALRLGGIRTRDRRLRMVIVSLRPAPPAPVRARGATRPCGRVVEDGLPSSETLRSRRNSNPQPPRDKPMVLIPITVSCRPAGPSAVRVGLRRRSRDHRRPSSLSDRSVLDTAASAPDGRTPRRKVRRVVSCHAPSSGASDDAGLATAIGRYR